MCKQPLALLGFNPAMQRQISLVEKMEIVGGEIESDGNILLSECFDLLASDIASKGRIGDIERRSIRVKHAESRMMFGGENHIADSREAGQCRPFVGIEPFGIEQGRQILRVAIQIVF